jgi:hypothetical protein
MLWLWWRR